jgi:hypothetical protein
MKDILVAGDTLDNLYTVERYPASDGWTLRFRLLPQVATIGPPIDFVGIPIGDDYRIQAGPSITSNWKPGEYTLARWVEKPGARYNVEPVPALPRIVTIRVDPATSTFFDGRSTARRNLEAIEAYLADSGSKAAEYEIAGRRLVNHKLADLIALADRLRRDVQSEDLSTSLADGGANPRRVYLRFGRA